MAAAAARVLDTTAHGGQITGPGSTTVFIEKRKAARVGDGHTCPIPGKPPHVGYPIARGSTTVFIEGIAAARVGDPAPCNGPSDKIATGASQVFIGG